LLCCLSWQIIEEVIHEEEEEDDDEVDEHEVYAVEERRHVDEPHFMLPQQTYHHLIGRAFGVAFNDRSFVGADLPTSGADRYYYGSLGTFNQPTYRLSQKSNPQN